MAVCACVRDRLEITFRQICVEYFLAKLIALLLRARDSRINFAFDEYARMC